MVRTDITGWTDAEISTVNLNSLQHLPADIVSKNLRSLAPDKLKLVIASFQHETAGSGGGDRPAR